MEAKRTSMSAKKEAQRDRWLIYLLLLIILLQQMSYRTRGEGLVSKFIRVFFLGVTPREMFWQITSCGCYVQYDGKFKMKWLDDKFCRPASLAQFRGWRTDCEYGERSLSSPLYHTITHQHLRNLSAAAQKER